MDTEYLLNRRRGTPGVRRAGAGRRGGRDVVVGMGVDIVEVERWRAVERRRARLLPRLFTPDERGMAPGPRADAQYYAGRFAAKEAVLKALGTGLRSGCWHDVEVGRDGLGRPVVRLRGGLAERARALGVGRVLVSISHTRHYAVASAIAVAGDAEEALPWRS